MSILLFLFTPALLAIYWIVRLQISLSRVRYLVDTYGLSRKKLRSLKYNELRTLQEQAESLRISNDAYALEALIKPYRA